MGHGGKRDGAGRKGLAEEMGLPVLVQDVLGDEGKKELLQKIWDGAQKGNFLQQQLLMAYIFGKPKEKLDVTSGGEKLDSRHEIIFRDFSKK